MPRPGSACEHCGRWIEPRNGRLRRWCDNNCRRRDVYSGVCSSCGTTTYNGGGRAATSLCAGCHGAKVHEQTQQRVLTAMRKWADLHGKPPRVADWRKGGGEWPTLVTIQRAFGTWNAAVAAAGLTPRPRGRQP